MQAFTEHRQVMEKPGGHSVRCRNLDEQLCGQLWLKGLSVKNEAEVLHYIESADASIQLWLAQGDEREEVERYRTDEMGTLGFLEQVRKNSVVITLEQRRVAELFDHIRRGDVGLSLIAALQEINASIPSFFDRFATAAEFFQFFASIQTLDVSLTLALARDQDLVRRIDRNGSRDLIGLSVAIPYSNLVVTEKFWCHMARFGADLDVARIEEFRKQRPI